MDFLTIKVLDLNHGKILGKNSVYSFDLEIAWFEDLLLLL